MNRHDVLFLVLLAVAAAAILVAAPLAVSFMVRQGANALEHYSSDPQR